MIDNGKWNVLAVARQRMTRAATRALAPLGKFRPSGYPRVLVGSATGAGGVAGIVEFAERLQAVHESLVRLQPMDSVLSFERDDVTEVLCVALQDHAHLFAGTSFHVRVKLRGMKGRLESQAVERALGDFIFEHAAAAGRKPTVSFADPELVLAVEVVGRRVGYAVLDRELRARDLVRVR